MANVEFITPHEHSNVIPFPDDEIELNTGLTLVDVDAEVVARRLRLLAWDDRARFFNNIIVESIENSTKLLGFCRTKADGRAFINWGMVEMMRKIANVLDIWDEWEVKEEAAATIFRLSLNPEHQEIADKWIRHPNPYRGRDETDKFFDTWVQTNWQALAIFYRLVGAANPCAWAALQAGRIAGVDDWFDFDMVPDDEDDDVSPANDVGELCDGKRELT